MDPRPASRALLACGIVGPLLFLGVFTVEGALRPGYSSYHHYVSTLSLGERGWVQVANFLANGTLLLLASVGWRRALAPGVASRGAPIALAVVGAGFLLAGIFVADPALGYPPDVATPDTYSTSSSLHGLGALLVFFGVAVTAFLYARRAAAEGERRWSALSIVAGVVVLAFFFASSAVAAMETSGRLAESPTGLLQRVSAFAGQGWIAAASWRLLRARA